ncbi:ABC transporter permease [Tunturiibacter gelidoferens]|uniref:Permease n=1 Tax=Tunturiibacter gelidiferens TaxID=3069689 RepID=A0ACC5NTM8_9BACT|nr:ABC transporter permease [Edaphobacter lichenicola]MBB5337875.1 putative permease [Edaphobacter lichenicola]
MATLLQDLRFALRQLRKSPGFTIAALVTLALAIGANALIFGVLNTLILRPLNVPQAEGLFVIQHGSDGGWHSYPDYLDIRRRNRSFDDIAAWAISQAGLDTGKDPSKVWAYETSGNYFDVLQVHPYLGRFFHASDEHGSNSAPFVVLSYAYWHSHFQDDRGVVGRVIRINRHAMTILGVTPPGFQGTVLFFTSDIFVPIVNHEQLSGEKMLNARGNHWMYELVGHLKTGVNPEQAAADLNSVNSDLRKSYPQEEGKEPYTLGRPGLHGDYLGRPMRGFLTGLMLLSVLILLAACANLGSLFAARAADRSREVALRLALGSSRNRILRQLLTESVLLSTAGGVAGLMGNILLLRRLSEWRPFPQLPLHVPVSPDAKVYLLALVLALVSGVLSGIVPVRQVLRANPYEIVKAGSTGAFGRRISVRDVLLVVQIAICVVLVTSSMVALRGLVRTLHSNFGFEPQNTMLVDTDLRAAGYSGERIPVMQRRMIDAVQAIPGVDSVGSVNYPPLELPTSWRSLVYTDATENLSPSNAAANPCMYNVSPDYFRASGTSLLAGRAFTWHDDTNAPRVAVVNREFATKILGSLQDAVGQHFKLGDGTRVEVVGLVEDGKYVNLAEEKQPAMFFPLLQSPASWIWLVVQSRRDQQQLGAAIRGTLRDIDPGVVLAIRPWNEELAQALFPSRMATVSLGVLGMMGAMLSITGIFGMAAYSVSKRLRELGIRIALGAKHKEVLQAALGRAVKLLAIGSTAGLVLGVLASRVLASIVYQATSRDPLVLVSVVLTMLLLGLVATWIPAQRALGVDPLILLREE